MKNIAFTCFYFVEASILYLLMFFVRLLNKLKRYITK